MTYTAPIGQARLFSVGPTPGEFIRVITECPSYRVVLCTHLLAAAAITAASTARTTNAKAWVTLTDSWHATVRATTSGYLVAGSPTAPLDALRRAIDTIPEGTFQ